MQRELTNDAPRENRMSLRSIESESCPLSLLVPDVSSPSRDC